MTIEYWSALWVAISALATFIMAIVTFWGLFQNRKQLSELKRQWNEQNRAKIIPLLERENGYVCLRLKNYSNMPAYNIILNITVESDISIHPIQQLHQNIEKLSSVKYIIEPNGIKDLKMFIDYNPSITKYDGDLNVEIQYNKIYTEKHILYLSELNTVMIPPEPIQNTLNDISKKLGRL